MCKVNDKVFGNMVYKHSWTKKELFKWGSKEYNLKITAQAYNGDAITDSQRKQYSIYKKSYIKTLKQAMPEIVDYLNQILDKKNIEQKDVYSLLIPKTVIFNRENGWGVLFASKLDVENGIAIFVINNKIKVGPQEIFL